MRGSNSTQLIPSFAHRIRSMAMLMAIVGITHHASAQLVISDPAVPNENVRQVSVTQPIGDVPSAKMADFEFTQDMRGVSRTPVRVIVQYLMVDEETRDKIFAQLDPDSIRRATHHKPEEAERELHEIDHSELSTIQLSSPSRITACLIGESEASAAVTFATESLGSKVSRAPSVLLLEGKPAELNDIVQRPFVIDLVPNGTAWEPKIEVLDDGNKIRMLASMPGGTAKTAPIHLKVEFTTSRILSVATDKIFGLQDEPLSVQVPTHQIATAFTSVEIPAGKTLLLDPHVSSTSSISTESSVPVLGKIPYVGRSFMNTAIAEVEQHLIVLFKPSIEDPVR